MGEENNKRRKYDKEFKVKAVKLLKESGQQLRGRQRTWVFIM